MPGPCTRLAPDVSESTRWGRSRQAVHLRLVAQAVEPVVFAAEQAHSTRPLVHPPSDPETRRGQALEPAPRGRPADLRLTAPSVLRQLS